MEKTLTFDKYSTNKNLFHKNKNPITINKVDIKRIVLSNKVSYGKQGTYKYYVGYIYIYIYSGFIPLYIVIPQINFYTNYINILANDKEFLKYIEIWNKIKDLFKNLFNKRFDSEFDSRIYL